MPNVLTTVFATSLAIPTLPAASRGAFFIPRGEMREPMKESKASQVVEIIICYSILVVTIPIALLFSATVKIIGFIRRVLENDAWHPGKTWRK